MLFLLGMSVCIRLPVILPIVVTMAREMLLEGFISISGNKEKINQMHGKSFWKEAKEGRKEHSAWT